MLEADGDLEGLADAWLMVSKLRFWTGRDPVRTDQALERATDFARQSANHRAERESTLMTMYNLVVRPIPADEAVSRPSRCSRRPPAMRGRGGHTRPAVAAVQLR